MISVARRFARRRVAERSYHRAMRGFNAAACDLRGPMSLCNGLRCALPQVSSVSRRPDYLISKIGSEP
ncbi:MAG: hypothetical protein CR217_18355 [Beijerinckiaceae bacterium]|nr:MAG: hypothetical protein CR217_18355 [Beijerinckiaceae bacterium]